MKEGLEELVADYEADAALLMEGLREYRLYFDVVPRLTPREQRAKFSLIESSVKVPVLHSHCNFRPDLIYDYGPESYTSNISLIKAKTNLGEQPLWMFIYMPSEGFKYLTLAMPVPLNSVKPVLLESLPPIGFDTLGLQYNLLHNPKYRQSLSIIAQKRLPIEVFYDNEILNEVLGVEERSGIDASVRLHFQNPNPKNHLKCYAVEIRSGGEINPPITSEIAPEAIWQPKENHYCMIGFNDSYPLIPVDLEKISKFSMVVGYQGNSPKLLLDLLSDLPLSLDGTNQWYAGKDFGIVKLELFYKPQWKENNLSLVYRFRCPPILPIDISRAVGNMSAIKSALIEKLAA